MRVRFTDTANDETDQLLAHIASDNPSAAAAVAEIIEATVARLSAFPRLGAATDVPGVRMIVVRPHPYLIFYAIEQNVLVVRNVRHPARRRPHDDQS